MSKSKRWIVTTSGDQSMGKIKKSLTETGFKVEQVLDEIGCVIGTASDSVAKDLRAISGVADVSPDEPINIGKPDDPETW